MKKGEQTALPIVSIIIPCYNDGQYLGAAVSSAQVQTYPHCEIILVNDGSTDALTNAQMERYATEGIKVIQIKQSGPAAARNAGIEKAKGKYILPLDADDTIHRRYVAEAVKVIEQNPEVGIVYCRGQYFGERNDEMVLPKYSLENIFLDNMIFVSALFRKSSWKKVKGFDPAMRDGMEDYDFWLGLIEKEKCQVHRINKILFYCRVKKESRTTRMKAGDKMPEIYTRIFYNHQDLFLRENNMLHYIRHRQSMQRQINFYGEIIRQSPAMKVELRLRQSPRVKRLYDALFLFIETIWKKIEGKSK